MGLVSVKMIREGLKKVMSIRIRLVSMRIIRENLKKVISVIVT
jgi:hypothetical protein